MKRDELLRRLNGELQPDERRVTCRMLEDWAYEDLIAGPDRGTGTAPPNWQWPEASLAEALEVIDVRRRGFKRAKAIRAQLWLEGRERPARAVLEDLISEFVRARNLMIRYVTSTYDIHPDTQLTERRKLAIGRQLGPLDASFVDAGVDFGRPTFLLGYELARFGKQITAFSPEEVPLAPLLLDFRCESGVHVLAGLLETEAMASPSAVFAMRSLDPEDSEKCRMLAHAPLVSFEMMKGIFGFAKPTTSNSNFEPMLDKVSLSLRHWPWSIFFFGMAANYFHNSKLKSISC